MIPVVISNDGTVTTISSDSDSWYNYEKKQWANVVLVNSSKRDDYLGTNGKNIDEDDILAYYVWIPRYKYKGALKYCKDLDYPSEKEHPECYLFKISSIDKTGLIIWRKEQLRKSSYSSSNDELLTEEATEDIKEMIKTGKMKIGYNEYTIREIIEIYNDETQSNATYKSIFKKYEKVNDGPTTIDIVFESKNAFVSKGNAITSYKTHPAFIWGNKKIAGFWVGKFETSAESTSICYKTKSYDEEAEERCKDVEPRILPNVKSLVNQNISTQFTTSLKFARGISMDGKVSFAGNNIYGLTEKADSHMMKNSEWGAVAYLSHSNYGINSKIESNTNAYNITGCGTGKSSLNFTPKETGTNKYLVLISPSIDTKSCENKYGAVQDYPQSTTGNISGIFDLSGGTTENLMAVLSDEDGNPISGWSLKDNSGFDGTTYNNKNEYEKYKFDQEKFYSGISFPNKKYYDLYLQKDFNEGEFSNLELCTLKTCGGHALHETANWYSNKTDFIYKSNPWFSRESLFEIDNSGGGANSYSTWRSILIIGANK